MNFSFLPQYLDYFNDGILVTILISVIVVFLGSILGTLTAIAKMSHFLPLRWLANVYIEIFRNTPMLLQIMVGSILMAGRGLPSFPIGIIQVNLNFLIPGITVLVINSGAYIAEIVRAGITAVPKGQTEAAHSLGIRPTQTMITVILPQAIRNILPAIGNEFVTIIKDSSLLTTIGIIELYGAAQIVLNRSYIALYPLIFAGLYYFVVCFVTNRLLGFFEKRMGKGYAK